MTTNLPPKLYFRIGEVSSLVGVEPHVLRYWEREFRVIRPTKSAKGQRVYSRRDVENLQRVRELLYTDGFTIAGARKKLTGVQKQGTSEPSGPSGEPAPDPAHGLPADGALALSSLARSRGADRDGSGAVAGNQDATESSAGEEIEARAEERPKVLRTTKAAANAANEPQNEARERTLTQLRELRTEVQAFLEELGG